jgi:class 3 adenylate cyclase/tetratricopeptide (TPR) repeat protein
MAEAYRHGRQAEKAKTRAQQALKIGQDIDDAHLCAYGSFALGLAHINGLYVGEAVASWQNALVYARQVDDLILQGWTLHRIPLALTLLGQFDEAKAVALEACELTRKTQDWSNYSVGLSHLASSAVAKGDFDVVERCAHEAILMVSRSHYGWGGFRSLLALACTRALRGAWGEAEDALDILVEPGRIFEDAGLVIQTFARAFRQLLRVHSQGVGEALEPLAAELMRVVGTDTYALAPLCALVELCDLMDAPALTELPEQALSQAAERGVLFSSGWIFLIPRILGVSATLKHRWDTAEAYFEEAINVATNAGALPELGRSYLDYARMLAVRHQRHDRRRAIDLVRQADPIFLELGMEPSTRQAAQFAEALQTRIPLTPRAPAAYPDNLNEREVKVLVRLAQGRTNQEIADDLVVDSKTVASHISNIFNKIGVKNEIGVTAYAMEKRLISEVQPGWRMESPVTVRGDGAGGAPSLHIILITDMQASSALIDRWGDAQAHDLILLYNAIIRDCLHAYHGTEVTHTGDGIEASFSSASSAVECAVAIQKAFAKHNQEDPTRPIHVRMGINAGEPISTEGRLFGRAVHIAFRICARAQPGQILISDVVHQLVAGKGFTLVKSGRVTLKGFSGRVRLYEVLWESDRT